MGFVFFCHSGGSALYHHGISSKWCLAEVQKQRGKLAVQIVCSFSFVLHGERNTPCFMTFKIHNIEDYCSHPIFR